MYDYGSRLGFSGPEIKASEAVAGDSLLYPECRDMLVDVFSKRIDEVCKLARAFHCAAKRKGMAKWLALGWFFVNKGENRYTIPFKSLTDSQISKLWVDVTPPTERSDPSLRRYARAALTREQVREHISNPPFASQFPSFIILARELTTNQFLDHVIEWGGRKKFTKESAAENAKRMLTRERRSAVDLHFEMERIPRSRGDTARMLCPQKVVAGTGHDVHSRTSEETVAQKKLGPPQGPRPVA